MKFFAVKFLALFLLVNATYSSEFGLKDKFIVAIDIGHSKKSQGAVSSRGVGEFYFNKKMAIILLEKLKSAGFSRSFIIDTSINSGLKNRTKVAFQRNASVFISIHHDSVQKRYIKYWKYKGKKNHFSDKYKGYSIFISNNTRYSKKNMMLASAVGEHLHKNKFTRTLHHSEKIKGENRKILDNKRGVYEFNDLTVLKSSRVPAILLECGVIVNREEEVLLSDYDYQHNFIASVVAGINEYYLKN